MTLQERYLRSIQQQIEIKSKELEEVKQKITDLNGKTDIKELSQHKEIVEAVRQKEQEALEERQNELSREKARIEQELGELKDANQ